MTKGIENADGSTMKLQLSHPPTPVPRLDAGTSRLRAQQAAERAITTGALDAPGVEATIGDLPYEAARDAQADVETATLTIERMEADAIGTTLLEDARQGGQVDKIKGATTNSVVGVEGELRAAEMQQALAAERHAQAARILDGQVRAPDGTERTGNPVAPEARTPRAIRTALRGTVLLGALPVLVPLSVEGMAVTFNMHAYLRVDDDNWLTPVVIAVITVSILTIAPFLIGVILNDHAHGKKLARMDVCVIVVVAAFWMGVGIALALVRVQVDGEEAVRAAEARQRQQAITAQQLGQPVDTASIDPNLAFRPELPIVFWILVFIGFGTVLLLWERLHRNPATLAELRSRLTLAEANERVHMLRAHHDALAGSVAAQERVNGLAIEMWDAEVEVVRANATLDTAEYQMSLGEAARDPEMPLAVERHVRRRAAQSPSQ